MAGSQPRLFPKGDGVTSSVLSEAVGGRGGLREGPAWAMGAAALPCPRGLQTMLVLCGRA